MPKSNAERQAAWRARRADDVARLQAENAARRTEVARLKAEIANLRAEIERLRLRNAPPPPLPDELPPRVKRPSQPQQPPRDHGAEPKPPPPPKQPRYDKRFPMLRVTRPLTVKKVSAAYRAASKHYHPDAGGSHTAMTLLNREHEFAMQLARQAAKFRD
jgi:hypothetical protein